MTLLQRIAREPVAIAGVLIALYSLSVAFDVLVLTNEQYGAVGGFLGAVVFFLRWLTTPSTEVVAQFPPNSDYIEAGPALSGVPNGTPVTVDVTDHR
jgi:hypothetical protein